MIGKGINAKLVDTREVIKTDDTFGDAKVLENESKELVLLKFAEIPSDTVAVVTGFIASTVENETTTLDWRTCLMKKQTSSPILELPFYMPKP